MKKYKKLLIILTVLLTTTVIYADVSNSFTWTMNQQLIRVGSHGEQVRELQQCLTDLGNNPGSNIDGEFGPITKTAVIEFQTEHNLKIDGIIGNETGPHYQKVCNEIPDLETKELLITRLNNSEICSSKGVNFSFINSYIRRYNPENLQMWSISEWDIDEDYDSYEASIDYNSGDIISCYKNSEDEGEISVWTTDDLSRKISNECKVLSGCNGPIECVNLSVDEGSFATTCESLPEYSCYQNSGTICTIQNDGNCGWEQDSNLLQCIEDREGLLDW